MSIDVGPVVERVRERAPLVHCLTAAVSMNFVADALLAAGARPMMTETLAEAPSMVRLADAVLANLGTLSSDGLVGIPATVDVATERGLPWVLDPAAIGPSALRLELAQRLLARRPTVVRGNASEVLVLAGRGSGGRGADSTDEPTDALEAATTLVGRGARLVSISGQVDLVTDGELVAELCGGDEMLTRVTGTGCVLGGLTAACCAVATPMTAALAANAWLALAAERARSASRGPGSFKIALLDELAAVEPHELGGRVVLR